MYSLDYLEVKIINNCNYRCRGCIAFGNIAAKSEYGTEQYERDMKRTRELFGTIKTIRLLGGEPLLSANVINYLKITKKYFDDTDIRLATNGSLLGKMNDEFFTFIKDNSITIDISDYAYKAEQNVADNINVDRLIENNIGFVKNEVIYFSSILHTKINMPCGSADEVFGNCRNMAQYNNLYGGKIYPCIACHSIRQYDAKFSTSFYNPNDGIDIHKKGITGSAIIDFLGKPAGFCSFCTGFGRASYFKCKDGNAQAYDWEHNDASELYRNRVTLSEYFKADVNLNMDIFKIAEAHSKTDIKLLKINDAELNALTKIRIYIWIESTSELKYFQNSLKIFLSEENIHYSGLIDNGSVRDASEYLINKEHVVFPSQIVFFSSNSPTKCIQSYKNIKRFFK